MKTPVREGGEPAATPRLRGADRPRGCDIIEPSGRGLGAQTAHRGAPGRTGGPKDRGLVDTRKSQGLSMSAISRPGATTSLSNDEIDSRIHLAIVDAILDRQLKPGTRLVEAPLCEAFGVTRGTLRRVFVKLAQDGVITLQPNRGAIVAVHRIDEAREVFEARMFLEIGSVKSIARKTPPALPATLREMVRREQGLHDSGQWRQWIRLSGEFHLKLTEANGNDLVTGVLRSLIARTSLLIGMYEVHNSSCTADEHDRILDAIESGNAARAATLMERHLGEYASGLLTEPAPSEEVNLGQLFTPVHLHR